tara:strand:+ start:81 stop:218 length:138 start_codon:yes stop_codon:yes gene_type:complete
MHFLDSKHKVNEKNKRLLKDGFLNFMAAEKFNESNFLLLFVNLVQ